MVHAKGVGRAPITSSSPFVKTAGTNFVVAGKKVVFAGTNAFYLLIDSTSDADVLKFFETAASKVRGWGRKCGGVTRATAPPPTRARLGSPLLPLQGVTLVRFFAFSNGYGIDNIPMRTPLQPKPGVYDENMWRRMDLILATAAKAGIRLIAPLANFEPELGGIDWYAREVIGSSDKQQVRVEGCGEREAGWCAACATAATRRRLRGILGAGGGGRGDRRPPCPRSGALSFMSTPE